MLHDDVSGGLLRTPRVLVAAPVAGDREKLPRGVSIEKLEDACSELNIRIGSNR